MKYVVIGASAAGVSGIRTLRKQDPHAEIILIAPDRLIYSRCILHKYIDGERTEENLSFVEPDFISNHKVTWIKAKVTHVCPDKKMVALDNDSEVSYDKLLITAGSITKMPPVKNLDKAKPVFGLRTIEEAESIKQAAIHAKSIAVIGAGLIGCDAITGLLHSGAEISCYDAGTHLLPMNLDTYAAATYQKAFGEKGVLQHYGVFISELFLDEHNNITGLKLNDNREFACDMVIVASGVRANIDFLEDSGLETDRFGLIYDLYGKTSDDHIYAAGDISGKSPIWPMAVKEGIIAANNMTGTVCEMTDFFASKATLNFLGIPTMSLGVLEKPDDSFEEIVDIDNKGNYKKIIHKDGEIKGAVLQGDLSYAGILTQLIREKIDVSKVKKPLFKLDYSDFFGEFSF